MKRKILQHCLLFSVVAPSWAVVAFGQKPPESTPRAEQAEAIDPLVRTFDLELGVGRRVMLHDGTRVTVRLVSMHVARDNVMKAIRSVYVTLEVNGESVSLYSGNYNRPVEVGGVQIDCPVTKDYDDSHIDHWALERDARVRLWPAGSRWLRKGTFVYPLEQRWGASATWFSNEPVSPRPNGKFYYHAGLDLGGAEALDIVVAATDGLVVQVGEKALDAKMHPPVQPRYDVVYIRDDRGWYYRYSHLHSIDAGLELGKRIRHGTKIGLLGKEGGSGGWSHLHFEIKSLQPSGRWGTQDGYAFLWEAYRRQYDPDVIAVAQPRQLISVGAPVALDGSKSWARNGIAGYEWTTSSGKRIRGAAVTHVYDRPGDYCEILKVTDGNGRSDYDFARVKVVEYNDSNAVWPWIHASFHPSRNVSAGDEIVFKVRTSGSAEGPKGMMEGRDVWDFGDGSPTEEVRSNPTPEQHDKNGYAVVTHRYRKPGDYIATVQRKNDRLTVMDRLHVRVEN